MPSALKPRHVGLGIAAALVLGAAALFVLRSQPSSEPAPLTELTYALVSPSAVERESARVRTVDVYRGLGTWVDGFDFSPPYSAPAAPPVTPRDLEMMAAVGVKTVYLQSGRLDERSPDLLEDRWLLADFLVRAHQLEMAVVAWYLPKWDDDSADLDHLIAAHEFEVLGHRFDGVAVDIEWAPEGLDVADRNERLIRLSRLLKVQVGADPLGAIVLPPVQIEVINPDLWPTFPWLEIEDLYDVWLPMSYWSFRSDPYDDGYSYNAESVRRLRDNLGDPNALVHAIGGVGAEIDAPPSGTEPYIARVDQLPAFAQSLVDTGAIGGSVYDWATIDDDGRAMLRDLFTTGVAASLGQG